MLSWKQPDCPEGQLGSQWDRDAGCVNVCGGLMMRQGGFVGAAWRLCRQQCLQVKVSCTSPAHNNPQLSLRSYTKKNGYHVGLARDT